jgi:hypothetical protein
VRVVRSQPRDSRDRRRGFERRLRRDDRLEHGSERHERCFASERIGRIGVERIHVEWLWRVELAGQRVDGAGDVECERE